MGTWIAQATISTLVAVLSMSPVHRQPMKAASSVNRPVMSGTYIETAWVPGGSCSVIRPTLLSRVRALQIQQTADSLTVQVSPSQAIRVISIENHSPTVTALGRRGVGTWDGDALIVETETPALPLWGRLGAAGHGTLIERFIRLEMPDLLIYEAMYIDRRRSYSLGSFAVSLIRCNT